MILGLFRRSVKVVKLKRKTNPKKAAKSKVKKVKIKKATIKKKVAGPKKRKAQTQKVKKVAAQAKVMLQAVGRVTHYFPHVKAGVILVTDGNISIGDTLRIKGHTTDLKQKVSSIQINNVPIQTAKPGDEIGLLVKSRIRHNDMVYKL